MQNLWERRVRAPQNPWKSYLHSWRANQGRPTRAPAEIPRLGPAFPHPRESPQASEDRRDLLRHLIFSRAVVGKPPRNLRLSGFFTPIQTAGLSNAVQQVAGELVPLLSELIDLFGRPSGAVLPWPVCIEDR